MIRTMTELEQRDGSCNSDKIYFRKLRTVLRGPGKQERNTEITVNVEVQPAVSALFRQALLIRLTDDNDSFFLLTLKIVEEDFQILKCQQGLLVDFGAFPQKFVNLLEQCRLEENKDSPRFLLSLAVPLASSPATLDIVETNPFKHLVHLSLNFSAGSDSDIKSYLAGCLKSLKLQKERLECQLRSTETDFCEKLRVSQERWAATKCELDKIQRESTEKLEILQNRLSQQMVIEKDKALQASSELQYRHEREAREFEHNHKKTVAQLESRLANLESHNKELQETRAHLEVSNAELRRRLSSLEEESRTEKQQNSSLRKESATLEATARETERACADLKAKAALAEQELRAKEQTALKQQNLVDRLQEQKQRLEDENQQRQQVIVKREGSIKTLSEELQKGNEIIRKLQTEVRSQQAKLKVRNRITSEQEKVIAEKDEELGRLLKEAAVRIEEGRAKDLEIGNLKRDLEATTLKLEANDRVVKTNENVINWLNKQLNQAETTRKDALTATTVAHRPFDVWYTSAIPRTNFQNVSPVIGSVMTQGSAAAGAISRPAKPTQVRYSPNAAPWVPHKPLPTHADNVDGKVPVSTGLDPMYLQSAARRRSQSPTITAPSANARAPPTGSTTEGPRLPRALISPVTPPSATTPSSYFPATTS